MKTIPSYGLVYYVNPVTRSIAFYLSYGLEPGHEYLVEVTSDAVNYTPLHTISTHNQPKEIYFTYNVSSSAGPWPRVTEIK